MGRSVTIICNIACNTGDNAVTRGDEESNLDGSCNNYMDTCMSIHNTGDCSTHKGIDCSSDSDKDNSKDGNTCCNYRTCLGYRIDPSRKIYRLCSDKGLN